MNRCINTGELFVAHNEVCESLINVSIYSVEYKCIYFALIFAQN